jgi:hypothetical protein
MGYRLGLKTQAAVLIGALLVVSGVSLFTGDYLLRSVGLKVGPDTSAPLALELGGMILIFVIGYLLLTRKSGSKHRD